MGFPRRFQVSLQDLRAPSLSFRGLDLQRLLSGALSQGSQRRPAAALGDRERNARRDRLAGGLGGHRPPGTTGLREARVLRRQGALAERGALRGRKGLGGGAGSGARELHGERAPSLDVP